MCCEYGRGCSRTLQIESLHRLICGLDPQFGPDRQSAQLSFNLPWGGEIPPGQSFLLSSSLSAVEVFLPALILSFIYPYLFFIVIFSLVEPTYMLLYNGERWSWRATLLQSLAPTLKNPGKKIPNCILKTLISWFRCVWLELELNSAGTPALQDQRSPPLLYNIRIFSFLPPWVWGWVVTFIGFAVANLTKRRLANIKQLTSHMVWASNHGQSHAEWTNVHPPHAAHHFTVELPWNLRLQWLD